MYAEYVKQLASFEFFFRKKQVTDSGNEENAGENRLARVLNTLDLTALGVGSTLGAGIYVLAGSVIKEQAGPAVVLSFLIAAFASVLAGLCYAEFGARVPKTGSAYVYTYVTVGEFLAFIIGWNLILEYVIGTSSVARAFSSYFDTLVDNKIQNFFKEYMPMNIEGLSPYPDFFAFGITLLITCILAIGVKESSTMNNIFTGVNLFVVTFVIICGSIKADFKNWTISPNDLPINNTNHTGNSSFACNSTKTCGDGGFFPFGVSGMLAGAAKCFFAFVGFDCIATTGEEVKNPQRAIPISITLSLLICTIAYCGVSGVLSLMLPYYLIDDKAPMPQAFQYVGWNWARWVVAVGAICSLSTSLLGGMFPLPRVLYAIASDGLIFRTLAKINQRFKTPLIATFLSGIFAGAMAMLFDLDELVNMMSIGTLLAYSLVAISVVILRYQHETGNDNERRPINEHTDASSSQNNLITEEVNQTLLQSLLNPSSKYPTAKSARLVGILTTACTCDIVVICFILAAFSHKLTEPATIVFLVIFSLIGVFIGVLIWRQPQNKKSITFKIPFVPALPLISVFVNFYLMAVLNSATWIRFIVWMLLGFIIYFGYGIVNSSENSYYKKFHGLRNASYESNRKPSTSSTSTSNSNDELIRNGND